MVSGFVTSPFDHSRIWSGLASEMRIALKLLTSSMVLLHAAAWLGDVMRNSDERGRAGRGATPRGRGGGARAGAPPRGRGGGGGGGGRVMAGTPPTRGGLPPRRGGGGPRGASPPA